MLAKKMTDYPHKHPGGLWWLSIIYALFFATFALMLSNLTLFMIHSVKLSTAHAYGVFAVFAALGFTLPLGGGYLASKLGYKNACQIGLLACLIGFLALMNQSTEMVYLGVSIYLVGNALFTPSLWCLVDHLYTKNDTRRESGFTYFYLSFNIGAIVGVFLGSYIATAFGYVSAFAFAALVIIVGLIALIWHFDQLEFQADRHIGPQLSWSNFRCKFSLTMIGLICLPFIWLLLVFYQWNDLFTGILFVIGLFSVMRLVMRNRHSDHWHIIAFAVLAIISIVFWALYNLEPSLLSVFIEHNVKQTVFGLSIPAAAFMGFEGAAIVIVGLFLGWLWTFLGERQLNPSLPTKFSSGLIVMALGFLYLILVVYLNGENQILGFWPMVCAYLFFATAELLIGPIGISMSGRLGPEGSEGLLMGFWQLCTGTSAVLTGQLATMAVVPKQSHLLESNHIYSLLFFKVAMLSIVAGVIAFCVTPWIKRLIRR